MSASGGMSQLFKGIIIGVVLIMAIIGTMSLLDSDNPLFSTITKTTSSGDISAPSIINSPSITLNPNEPEVTPQKENNENIGDLNLDINAETIKARSIDSINKPVLEDERTAEQATTKEKPSVSYGVMQLKAINSTNGKPLEANYIVTDKNNTKVAESQKLTNTSYKLPTGQYKVEATLTRIDQETKQVIPVITKSRYIIVRENSTTNQIFQLEPPTITGVLQVSAKMNDQVIRANFVIQNANGEVVASRDNVTNSLFKLNTGLYKVSVVNGGSKDFRSVEVKSGESTQAVFILKETSRLGKLLVRIFDAESSNPIRADIKITSVAGTIIQDLKSTTKTELTLASGDYKISVVGPNGTSNKDIKINSGESLSEIFRFNRSDNNTASIDPAEDNSTQINENVTIKPVENQEENSFDASESVNIKGVLNISAIDESTKKPIKSNIYIQTLGGKHLDKKTYVDNASFNLEPGEYKVTVRAKDRKNKVKNIRISKNTNISDTFLLEKSDNVNTQVINKQQSNQQTNTPEPDQTRSKIKTIQTGFLNVAMRIPNNQSTPLNNLKTDFIITRPNGQKIVELTNVNLGNLKLDVGSYLVTAVHNKKRQNRRIEIRNNQNTRLNFNIGDFLTAKGILRSQIVDEIGRPLRGDLTVRNGNGQIVARANDVTSAVFNLPPARHTISVNFQGLSGSESVNINTNETTIQTFTIASGNN